MASLGTGFGDRFKVRQGSSGLFGEEVPETEELAVLQGKRSSKRCSLAVQQKPESSDGKEGVDGSSPSEGFKSLQIELFCCLLRREREDEYGGVA
jgi:hypothetical protein